MEKRVIDNVEWTLLSTAEATRRKLEEPNTTILLNAEEAAWRRRVQEFAARDPKGYLRACREDKPI